jgi:hypothetical protein
MKTPMIKVMSGIKYMSAMRADKKDPFGNTCEKDRIEREIKAIPPMIEQIAAILRREPFFVPFMLGSFTSKYLYRGMIDIKIEIIKTSYLLFLIADLSLRQTLQPCKKGLLVLFYHVG